MPAQRVLYFSGVSFLAEAMCKDVGISFPFCITKTS